MYIIYTLYVYIYILQSHDRAIENPWFFPWFSLATPCFKIRPFGASRSNSAQQASITAFTWPAGKSCHV